MCAVYPRGDKAGAGRGRRLQSRGAGAGYWPASPGLGCPPRGSPSPARGQVERGRGGGRAGPAPGVGPGGAGPRYANVAHGRPIAGAPRAAPSARPAGGRRETRASKRASERTAAVGIPERCAGPGRAGEREAARRGSRPGQPSASAAPQPSAPRPRPAPRAGECARSAPARGCPQPTRGEAAPSAPEPSHGPGLGPGLRLLTRSQPRNLSAGPRRPPRLRRSGERARAGPWPRGAASAAGPTGSPGSAAAEEVSAAGTGRERAGGRATPRSFWHPRHCNSAEVSGSPGSSRRRGGGGTGVGCTCAGRLGPEQRGDVEMCG